MSSNPSRAYAAGRIYALDHEFPPCSAWLSQVCGFNACDRHHFLNGFVHERATNPLARPVDLRERKCRCCSDKCGDDDLPYPYFGA